MKGSKSPGIKIPGQQIGIRVTTTYLLTKVSLLMMAFSDCL